MTHPPAPPYAQLAPYMRATWHFRARISAVLVKLRVC